MIPNEVDTKELIDKRYFKSQERFFNLIRQSQELRFKDCVDVLCRSRDQKTYTILSGAKMPQVLTFNLAWTVSEDRQPRVEELLNLLMLLPSTLDPFSTLFKRRSSQSKDELYFLKGMVCFAAQHYYAYFRDLDGDPSSSECGGDSWYLCDDHIVKRAATTWHELIELCLKAHSRPVMLIYERLVTSEQKERA